jgi:hypothetical protein
VTTREQLIAWHARWAEVNEAADGAARRLSPAQRFRDLAELRALAGAVALTNWPDDEEPAVWARFQQLRSVYRARHASR